MQTAIIYSVNSVVKYNCAWLCVCNIRKHFQHGPQTVARLPAMLRPQPELDCNEGYYPALFLFLFSITTS